MDLRDGGSVVSCGTHGVNSNSMTGNPDTGIDLRKTVSDWREKASPVRACPQWTDSGYRRDKTALHG